MSLAWGISERERSFAEASALYLTIDNPACQYSEFWYMRWLTDLCIGGLAPMQNEQIVTYNSGNKATSVVFIQKNDNKSARTKLILQSTDEPILEGMIVRDDSNEVTRPIYGHARYNQILYFKNKALNDNLEKLDLSAPPIYSALTIILSLLERMDVPVGPQFESNVNDYSEILESRGSTVTYWRE